jgi:hypothetical protein
LATVITDDPRFEPTAVILTLVIANDPGVAALAGSVSTLVIRNDPATAATSLDRKDCRVDL